MEVMAYGLDYSARELSPAEIDDYNLKNPDAPISFLIRYIGYPDRRKCVSAYPGALRAHEDAGRPVWLVHQDAYQDFGGGWHAGIAHARLAVADAERAGWRWDRPIFAAFDRWMGSRDPARGIYPIGLDIVRGYMEGFESVLGHLAGLYGFSDVMGPCVAENWVPWRWQCGAESAVVQGVQLYQWNNGRVYVNGLECDLNKSYVSIGGNDVGVVDSLSPNALAQIRDELMFHYRPSGWNPETGQVEVSPYNHNDFIWWRQRTGDESVALDRLNAATLTQLAAENAALRAAVEKLAENAGITPAELQEAITGALRDGGARVEIELKAAPAMVPTRMVEGNIVALTASGDATPE